MEKQKFEQLVKESKTIKEVLNKMGITVYLNGYGLFKRYIKKYNIDTSHFWSRSQITRNNYSTGKSKTRVLSKDEVFVENSSFSRAAAKRLIIRENLIEYSCECGNKGEWLGKKISLILDHINGIPNDHRLENLRFVCPNCEATLETHCLGSKGYDKEQLKEEKKQNKIRETIIKRHQPRLKTRKVERPEMMVLLNQINELGYVQTGKIYGVSDNAIRKWVKNIDIKLSCSAIG